MKNIHDERIHSNSTDLNEALSANMDRLCRAIGLEPNKPLSNRRSLRFGRHGSLAVEVVGRKQGSWFDHEAGHGGGPLKLIERETGTDWRGARDWALSYLGWSDDQPQPGSKKVVKPEKISEDDEREAKARAAVSRYGVYPPIEGTLAEKYLAQRGLTGPLPDNLRFSPRTTYGHPALVVPATNNAGDVRAIQMVHLTPDATKVDMPKISNGALKGNVVRFPGRGTLVIAEGVETALSIWKATGREVWAVLGTSNFASAPVPAGSDVTIAADDFKPSDQAEKATHAAVHALASLGCTVRLTSLPPGGGDFNDIHQRDGLDAVREFIEEAEIWAQPKVPRGVSLEEGVAELTRTITEFVHEAVPRYARAKLEPDTSNLPIKPDWIINGTTGIGKSWATSRIIAEHLDSGGEPVCVFVPTHKLSQLQATDFSKSTGIPAAVWRGLNADDPISENEKMCRNPTLSGAAIDAGVPVKQVCAVCLFRTKCGYVRQQSQQAPVWFLAHEMLFFKRPPGVPNPAFIVIDEDFRQAGMAENLRLSVRALETNLEYDDLYSDDRKVLEDGRAALVRALRASMRATGYGFLTTAALTDAGVTASLAVDCCDFEYKRKPAAQIIEGDIKATIDNLNVAAAKFTHKVPKLWELVSRTLSGEHGYAPCVEVRRDEPLPKGGGATEMMRLSYRKQVAGNWLSKPALILDATARPAIIQHFFPNAILKADICVSAPHEHVTWVNNSFSKARLVPTHKARERRNKSRRNNLEKVRRWIEVEATKVWPRKMLVICNLAVEEQLRGGPLSHNVVVSHFNDNRGVNSWGAVHWSDIDTLALIGRTLPDARQIHRQAERFAGKPLEPDDAITQAIRWLICEAELLNGGIGRGRGVHRTPDNSLRIVLLNDVPLPIAYDVVTNWEDAQPSVVEVMAARGFLGGDTSQKGYWRTVHAVTPDLFDTPDAARVAFSREQTSMNNISIDKCSRERTGYRHRVKPQGARYSVEVQLDGCSLLSPAHQYFEEVETLEFPKNPHAGALVKLWRDFTLQLL